MKLFKSFALFSLSAIMSVSLYAEIGHQNSKQTVKKAQQSQAKKTNNTQKSNKNVSASTKDKQLKQFTDSLDLRFLGVKIMQANNQPVLNLSYQLINKSKNNIKQVHWATIFGFNGKAIFVQDEPIVFNRNSPLKPSAVLPLAYNIPFNQLPREAQQVFSNPANKVSVEFQAKGIDFTNGKKIVVK